MKIDFHFHVRSRTLYCCWLLRKVLSKNLRAAVWSTDPVLLRRAYDDLWRFEDLAFLPHAWAGTPEAGESPVVFGGDLDALPACDVIVLLDERVPDRWQERLSRWPRAVDIVSRDPQELADARVRYRTYKAQGAELSAYDRSGTAAQGGAR